MLLYRILLAVTIPLKFIACLTYIVLAILEPTGHLAGIPHWLNAIALTAVSALLLAQYHRHIKPASKPITTQSTRRKTHA